MKNSLEILPIGELLNFSFLIPSYQRGYRWKKQQVKDLLKDIWDYKIDHSNPEAFYCLQPVVVKPAGDKNFKLIDGQQRLTTIALILHHFNETEFKTPKKLYTLKFETRIAQADFLNIITDSEKAEKNIDLFHLNKAYQVVTDWFEKMEKSNPSIKGDFYSKLVNKVKVIWYAVNDDSSEIDIFTRLNIGKIPLTNAELIKALFLSKSSNSTEAESRALKQISIAGEWDKIEQKLQKPVFWHFISNEPEKYDTRIEFIFDLMKHKKPDDEKYYTFYKFHSDYEKLKDQPNAVDAIWLSIKEYFLTFEEWYQDQELYHLIGYLVAIGRDINDLKDLTKGARKSNFKNNLRAIARKSIKTSIPDLNYDDHKKDVKNTLLLFNIMTIVEQPKSSLRFPFNHFHNQNWDIEHIRSQVNKDINGKDKINWANTVLDYFTGSEYTSDNEEKILKEATTLEAIEQDYCNRLLTILKNGDEDNQIFGSLHDELRIYFKEDESIDDLHSISNLTLLDEGTNRKYKNAFFPVKRKHIIAQEKEGIFIPLCTKNVFLKAYSKKLGEVMYWNNADGANYLEEITKTIK